MKTLQWLVGILVIINLGLISVMVKHHVLDKHGEIPNMVGTWKGKNLTVSDLKGYKEWGEKVVHITEQQDRRFRGAFTYPDGTKHFFGVVYPDNTSFTWVATNSKGFNHGRILGKDHIAACYVESWEEATAGCATLARQTQDQ